MKYLLVSAKVNSLTYLSFCEKSEMVVAVPVYSKEKKRQTRIIKIEYTKERLTS